MQVEELLQKKQIHFVPKGKDILVCCFNPEHEDSSPSMRIDKETGMYHCFSCGYKGNIFKDFNLYRNIFTTRVRSILDTIKDIKCVNDAFAIPEDSYIFNKPFRGISAATISKFGAFLSDSKEWEGRIVFPLSDATGTVKALIGRYMFTNVSPKYMVKPEEVKMPLFPSPTYVKPINNSIVLVEGLFDALNLIDKGMENAVCCFGTNQLEKSVIKDKLMPYRIMGIEKIFVMMDGDAAGLKAAAKIKELILYHTDFLVEVLPLAEGTDPGDMSQQDVDSLKNYLQTH